MSTKRLPNWLSGLSVMWSLFCYVWNVWSSFSCCFVFVLFFNEVLVQVSGMWVIFGVCLWTVFCKRCVSGYCSVWGVQVIKPRQLLCLLPPLSPITWLLRILRSTTLCLTYCARAKIKSMRTNSWHAFRVCISSYEFFREKKIHPFKLIRVKIFA